jgi:hypothetical protein
MSNQRWMWGEDKSFLEYLIDFWDDYWGSIILGSITLIAVIFVIIMFFKPVFIQSIENTSIDCLQVGE